MLTFGIHKICGPFCCKCKPCSSWPDATAPGLVRSAPNRRRSNSGQGHTLIDRLTMLLHRQAPERSLGFVSLRNDRCSVWSAVCGSQDLWNPGQDWRWDQKTAGGRWILVFIHRHEMMLVGHDRTMSMFAVHSASNESGPRFFFYLLAEGWQVWWGRAGKLVLSTEHHEGVIIRLWMKPSVFWFLNYAPVQINRLYIRIYIYIQQPICW